MRAAGTEGHVVVRLACDVDRVGLVEDALDHFDPGRTAPASNDIVLVGHSMGGLISRLMVSRADGELWEWFQAGRDLSPQQERRIRDRLGAAPAHLVLIPIDFEREAIADVLAAAPGRQYDREAPALVSWLGTICYLTHDAIAGTFASLAAACAPGSRVVFDYFEPKERMSPADLQLFETLDAGGARRGEPMQTLLAAEEMAEILAAAGWRVVEDLSAPEIRRRYLAQRTDGLDIPGFARLCCAEIGPG